MDPDLYAEYGSTKFLNTDPSWVRICIHNTDLSYDILEKLQVLVRLGDNRLPLVLLVFPGWDGAGAG